MPQQLAHSPQVGAGAVCVAGQGWYVEEGKDPVVLRPGVVVAIPAEAKHWHGAAKDSWMQHLTYMTKVEEGASNEWLGMDREHSHISTTAMV